MYCVLKKFVWASQKESNLASHWNNSCFGQENKQITYICTCLDRCFSSAEKHFYTLSVFWKVRKIINLVLCFRKIEWCYQYVWKRIICKNQTWLLWIPLHWHCELLTNQHFALKESYMSDVRSDWFFTTNWLKSK